MNILLRLLFEASHIIAHDTERQSDTIFMSFLNVSPLFSALLLLVCAEGRKNLSKNFFDEHRASSKKNALKQRADGKSL
jgi:hypothetical protein